MHCSIICFGHLLSLSDSQRLVFYARGLCTVDEWRNCLTHHSCCSLLRFTLSAEPWTSGHLHDAIAGCRERKREAREKGKTRQSRVSLHKPQQKNIFPQHAFTFKDKETTLAQPATQQSCQTCLQISHWFICIYSFFEHNGREHFYTNCLEYKSKHGLELDGLFLPANMVPHV